MLEFILSPLSRQSQNHPPDLHLPSKFPTLTVGSLETNSLCLTRHTMTGNLPLALLLPFWMVKFAVLVHLGEYAGVTSQGATSYNSS